MTNTKYTPGPWKAVQHPCEHKWAWTIEGPDGVGQSIARMGLVNDAQAVAANAHLIAAAPAMYEALQAMVEVFPAVVKMTPYGVSMDISKLHDNAKTALAQAEGRG